MSAHKLNDKWIKDIHCLFTDLLYEVLEKKSSTLVNKASVSTTLSSMLLQTPLFIVQKLLS